MTLDQGYKIVVEFIDYDSSIIKLDKTMIHAYFILEEHKYTDCQEEGEQPCKSTITEKRKELSRCDEDDFK